MQTYRTRDDAVEAARQEIAEIERETGSSYSPERDGVLVIGRKNRRYFFTAATFAEFYPDWTFVGQMRSDASLESFAGK